MRITIKSCDIVCPICNEKVDSRCDDSGYSISQRGHQQFFHVSCVTGRTDIENVEHYSYPVTQYEKPKRKKGVY